MKNKIFLIIVFSFFILGSKDHQEIQNEKEQKEITLSFIPDSTTINTPNNLLGVKLEQNVNIFDTHLLDEKNKIIVSAINVLGNSLSFDNCKINRMFKNIFSFSIRTTPYEVENYYIKCTNKKTNNSIKLNFEKIVYFKLNGLIYDIDSYLFSLNYSITEKSHDSMEKLKSFGKFKRNKRIDDDFFFQNGFIYSTSHNLIHHRQRFDL